MRFNFFLIYKRNRLRQVIKAHNYLSNNNNLHLINTIFLECISKPILTNHYENKVGITENSLNQYLVVRLFNKKLISSLLIGYMNPSKKVICIMPTKWIDVIENHGITVNRFLSKIFFLSICFMYICFGIKTFLKTFLEIFLNKSNLDKKIDFHFHKLQPNNFSDDETDKERKNIINWFKNKYHKDFSFTFSIIQKKKKYFNYLTHKIIPSDLKPLSFCQTLSFLILGFKYIMFSILNLIKGNFSYSIMFHEVMILNKLKCNSKNALAKEYFFNNTSYIYRPLWTYEAEKRGSKITLYFYSANIEPFIIDDIQTPANYGYKIMSWPNYLVWNESHAEFIKSCDKTKSSITIVGPIYFSDCKEKKIYIPKKTIALFDVTPPRISLLSALGPVANYYNYDVCKDFLEKVYQVAKKNNYTILFKQKRKVSKLFSDRRHENYISNFINLKNVITINSDTNAYHLIKEVKGVISMPFTSTDIIAKHLGKPSIFFDPSKRMKKRTHNDFKDESNILSSVKELDNWFQSLINI